MAPRLMKVMLPVIELVLFSGAAVALAVGATALR